MYTQLINSVFTGEYRELRLDFEELLGVIFSAQRSLKISSIFWGEPNTGKSVALNMISDMFAPTAVSNVSFSQFSEEFAVANLIGKALNVSGEISGIKERRMDLFNSIVGNDTIMACFKGKDYFKLKSNAFLAFACNDLPVIPPEVVDAFSTRVVIFPFMNAIPREKWIEDMNIKMRKEAELIAARAIMGLSRFIQNGNRFTHQEQLDLIKMDALCNLNSFKAFADRELVVDKKSFTSSHDITTAYEAFCEEYDLEVYPVQRWSRFLRQMFPKVKKTTKKDDFDFQKRGYEGVRLIHAEDNETINILRENPNNGEG